jgi:hypothetical protein
MVSKVILFLKLQNSSVLLNLAWIYMITIGTPTKMTRRSLILISKIIQNVANGVEFEGTKEPYMLSFNIMVTQHQAEMEKFEDSLAVKVFFDIEH